MRERRSCHLASVFPGIHLDVDIVDLPSDNPCISRLDIFFLACSIIMHIVDMCFDYNIAIRYYLAGKLTYFAWTICLILIPSLINVIISRRMQHQDKEVKYHCAAHLFHPIGLQVGDRDVSTMLDFDHLKYYIEFRITYVPWYR